MSATSQSAGILSFEQAREIVLKYCRQIGPPSSEEVSLLGAMGRVLAEPIKGGRGQPESLKGDSLRRLSEIDFVE